MHFERLKVIGFGCLRTELVFRPDRLNLLVDDNEAGKSTLIAALLAAFYGIVEDERVSRDPRPHRREVLPWTNPQEFGVELDFTEGGRRWTLNRDFHRRRVILLDRDTRREHQADYYRGKAGYRIGEEMLGLSCDDFLKSFYLRQEEIASIRDTGGLTAHVQRIASAREGEATSVNALQRLDQALRRYSLNENREGVSIDYAIRTLEKERDGLDADLKRLQRERDAVLPQCERMAALESEIAENRRRRTEFLRLGDLAEVRELEQLVERQENLRREYAELEDAARTLSVYSRFPADQTDRLGVIAGRVDEISGRITDLERYVNREVLPNLEDIERQLTQYQDIAGVTAEEAAAFEVASAHLADRWQRLKLERERHADLSAQLQAEGFDPERYARMKRMFETMPPDDVKFVEEFRVKYAEEEAVYREARVRRESLARDRDSLALRRQGVIHNARAFLIIAAVMALAGGLLMGARIGPPMVGFVLAGLGAMFAAAGLVVRGTAGSLKSSGLLRLAEELDEAARAEDEARKRLDALGTKLTLLATGLGLPDGNELMAEYASYLRFDRAAEPLEESARAATMLEGEMEAALGGVRLMCLRAGINIRSDDGFIADLQALSRRLKQALALAEQYRHWRARRDQAEEERLRLRKELQSSREAAAEILQAGGIVPSEPLATAVAAFRDALGQHRRYRAVTEEQMPRLKREILPDVDLAAKRDRLESLRAKYPPNELQGAVEHSKEYYREQAERALHAIDQSSEELNRIQRQIGAVLDRYQSHYPGLTDRLAEVESRLARTRRFKAEIMKAVEVMEGISREVYRSWAAALSAEAEPFLRALNPRYEQLTFRDDLTFTIRDRQTGRELDAHHVETLLSSGARDEVFLAVRLGISTYLARGARGALPIILDEPLASVDDDKFLSGMKFFLDVLSRRHQVIILSCHRERHFDLLARHAPQLFEERVHRLQLASEKPAPLNTQDE